MMTIQGNKLFLLLFLFIISCTQKSVNNEADYLRWINDEENNIIVNKYSNNFKLSLKYLPPEYSAYRELKSLYNYTQNDIDSLTDYYSKSMSFIFSLGPDEEHSNKNIMFYKVFDEVSFKERVQELNFGFSTYFSLNYNNVKLPPVLYLMENTYEVSNTRSFYIVFVPESEYMQFDNISEFEIVFHDEIFDTGITHFKFNKDVLNRIPKINFWNI